MFTLTEALDESLQVLPGCPVEQWLDALLQALRQHRGAPHEVVAQIALFRPDLISSVEQRHYCDADDQGQDDFQSRAHQDSSTCRNENSPRGWVRAAKHHRVRDRRVPLAGLFG